jgi:anaerobic magnesium-protoporphyrin IX monomethyl ester cyclase
MVDAMRLDLLLSHAYFLAEDPREKELMRPFPPLGLQYLVAWMRREGWEATDWFDTTFTAGPEDFHARVEETNPRVVGLYGHTITRPRALEMARRCIEEGRRVVAGGPDPVQYAEAYLDGGVEVLVIGEGERTLQELMEHLRANGWRWNKPALKNVEGILFRDDDGALVRTAPRALIRPIDQLPWPHRDRRDLDAYFGAWRARHGETAVSMNTSRGCPYHCSWCSKQVYGDTFRRREVSKVVDEVIAIREAWDPDQIWFVDDVFTINRKWVHRFCQEMVDRRAVIPFYLIARPESVDEPMLAALKEAGCYRIYMSAESGAQHVLDGMRKESSVDDVLRASALMKKVGIEIGTFVMLGYPGEEKDDIRATLRMLHAVDPEVTLLSVAHPMKGTAFYDDVKDRLEQPPGWAEKNGGRLAFRMRYPHGFYDVAQKHIWNETGLVRKIRRGEWDKELVKLAIKYPVWRAAFELYPGT